MLVEVGCAANAEVSELSLNWNQVFDHQARPETNAHNVALESPIDLLDLFVY